MPAIPASARFFMLFEMFMMFLLFRGSWPGVVGAGEVVRSDITDFARRAPVPNPADRRIHRWIRASPDRGRHSYEYNFHRCGPKPPIFGVGGALTWNLYSYRGMCQADQSSTSDRS
ncbi:hypothetical protein GOPIP_031_00120 [Gordonia polyisoprenivorans NBRC 16320 = JCM 10675]|nr:hypothetical protein GOPIP_031_00120 [Gordonia polyisoprenivorans NBRC 16320 = JCM 10675]